MRIARASLGLALVVAVGVLLGAVIELQLPFTGHSSAHEPAFDPTLDEHSAQGLGPGPIEPVLGKFDYGEGPARFQASRTGHIHEGQDMFAPVGTPLVASRPGVAVDAGPAWGALNGGRGNYLVIYNRRDGRSYVYM